uniref:[histone H3]-lysine(36) N-trimethyltransferase n=1 Tax=Musca domestica TaxID=7370 RepID=A0A1I8N425_MUSDO
MEANNQRNKRSNARLSKGSAACETMDSSIVPKETNECTDVAALAISPTPEGRPNPPAIIPVSECRRSSRKKIIKFDVRDLLNKNRKPHKIQIEARIDSNVPSTSKTSAGPANTTGVEANSNAGSLSTGAVAPADLSSKQKTFMEKSAIFRRYSISQEQTKPPPPPIPPMPPAMLNKTVGDKDAASAILKPKHTASLIVAQMESNVRKSAAVDAKRKTAAVTGNKTSECEPKVLDTTLVQQQQQQKRRGRPPKSRHQEEGDEAGKETKEVSKKLTPEKSTNCKEGDEAAEETMEVSKKLTPEKATNWKEYKACLAQQSDGVGSVDDDDDDKVKSSSISEESMCPTEITNERLESGNDETSSSMDPSTASKEIVIAMNESIAENRMSSIEVEDERVSISPKSLNEDSVENESRKINREISLTESDKSDQSSEKPSSAKRSQRLQRKSKRGSIATVKKDFSDSSENSSRESKEKPATETEPRKEIGGGSEINQKLADSHLKKEEQMVEIPVGNETFNIVEIEVVETSKSPLEEMPKEVVEKYTLEAEVSEKTEAQQHLDAPLKDKSSTDSQNSDGQTPGSEITSKDLTPSSKENRDADDGNQEETSTADTATIAKSAGRNKTKLPTTKRKSLRNRNQDKNLEESGTVENKANENMDNNDKVNEISTTKDRQATDIEGQDQSTKSEVRLQQKELQLDKSSSGVSQEESSATDIKEDLKKDEPVAVTSTVETNKEEEQKTDIPNLGKRKSLRKQAKESSPDHIVVSETDNSHILKSESSSMQEVSAEIPKRKPRKSRFRNLHGPEETTETCGEKSDNLLKDIPTQVMDVDVNKNEDTATSSLAEEDVILEQRAREQSSPLGKEILNATNETENVLPKEQKDSSQIVDVIEDQNPTIKSKDEEQVSDKSVDVLETQTKLSQDELLQPTCSKSLPVQQPMENKPSSDKTHQELEIPANVEMQTPKELQQKYDIQNVSIETNTLLDILRAVQSNKAAAIGGASNVDNVPVQLSSDTKQQPPSNSFPSLETSEVEAPKGRKQHSPSNTSQSLEPPLYEVVPSKAEPAVSENSPSSVTVPENKSENLSDKQVVSEHHVSPVLEKSILEAVQGENEITSKESQKDEKSPSSADALEENAAHKELEEGNLSKSGKLSPATTLEEQEAKLSEPAILPPIATASSPQNEDNSHAQKAPKISNSNSNSPNRSNTSSPLTHKRHRNSPSRSETSSPSTLRKINISPTSRSDTSSPLTFNKKITRRYERRSRRGDDDETKHKTLEETFAEIAALSSKAVLVQIKGSDDNDGAPIESEIFEGEQNSQQAILGIESQLVVAESSRKSKSSLRSPKSKEISNEPELTTQNAEMEIELSEASAKSLGEDNVSNTGNKEVSSKESTSRKSKSLGRSSKAKEQTPQSAEIENSPPGPITKSLGANDVPNTSSNESSSKENLDLELKQVSGGLESAENIVATEMSLDDENISRASTTPTRKSKQTKSRSSKTQSPVSAEAGAKKAKERNSKTERSSKTPSPQTTTTLEVVVEEKKGNGQKSKTNEIDPGNSSQDNAISGEQQGASSTSRASLTNIPSLEKNLNLNELAAENLPRDKENREGEIITEEIPKSTPELSKLPPENEEIPSQSSHKQSPGGKQNKKSNGRKNKNIDNTEVLSTANSDEAKPNTTNTPKRGRRSKSANEKQQETPKKPTDSMAMKEKDNDTEADDKRNANDDCENKVVGEEEEEAETSTPIDEKMAKKKRQKKLKEAFEAALNDKPLTETAAVVETLTPSASPTFGFALAKPNQNENTNITVNPAVTETDDDPPDPLKDIEKFIEDGVNLLKKGYKLDEDSVDNVIVTPSKSKADEEKIEKVIEKEVENEKKPESPITFNTFETPADTPLATPCVTPPPSNKSPETSLMVSTSAMEDDQNSSGGGVRRSHRLKLTKTTKALVGRGLVRDKERFSIKDDVETKSHYTLDDHLLDLAEVEAKNAKFLKEMEERLSNFQVIKENEYKCERVISREARKMICDCFLTPEEEERGELACGEDCLNRLLMIECGNECNVKDRCTNKRFQKYLCSPCRVFRTEKKGFGIMADIEILPGEFIMEYVGEVIDTEEFERRRILYSQEKNRHYYFMALRSDAIIDATIKGNISRFINHSCDPNAETQKWTVNGELRIGFFSRKSIMPGEEITFDYQYQRYGREAQRCYCESANCRGWIGQEPNSDEGEQIDDEEEDEDESDEEEEDEEERARNLLEDDEEDSDASEVFNPEEVQKKLEMAAAQSELELAPITLDGKAAHQKHLSSQVTKDSKEQGATPPKSSGEEEDSKSKFKKLLSKMAEKVAAKNKQNKREQKLQRRKKRTKDSSSATLEKPNKQRSLEDPDIEDEVQFLSRCGLKTQADTLRLSRLMVRAKLVQTRLHLLDILRKGELPCRRLFLDYHGLRLLHGWMSEDAGNMQIRLALLQTLELLPIANKTVLTDSKVMQGVRNWCGPNSNLSPNDDSQGSNSQDGTNTQAQSNTEAADSDDLQKLAQKLLSSWESLPEIFRIPKKERIEQMKEHEREADRQYAETEGQNRNDHESDQYRNDRFGRRFATASRFGRPHNVKSMQQQQQQQNNGGGGGNNASRPSNILGGENANTKNLSKTQRREMFAAKVARDEAEKRMAEERREFETKCRFFGLDPKKTRPQEVPFCVNPATGQWFSVERKPINTPPSYAHVQVPLKPKSTNPEDYQLPGVCSTLPPEWKYAITPLGQIYYYHVQYRIPQWEPPSPAQLQHSQRHADDNDSGNELSSTTANDSTDDDDEILIGMTSEQLKAYIDRKVELRRQKRYQRLVDERSISPRREEDRIYNQLEVRKYKENKEKIRKRKEEIRRKRAEALRQSSLNMCTLGSLASEGGLASASSSSVKSENEEDSGVIPIQDYLLSSDEDDDLKSEINSPLIDKIVEGDKIVDELDALTTKRQLKRPSSSSSVAAAAALADRQEYKKRKMEKKDKRKPKEQDAKYRRNKEKFRCEIAGIIVHHLKPYRRDNCTVGRITSNEDFNHLARKLTHFVMIKELKYCESVGQTLVVTESVKNKSREFIKKYMAKYGEVYVKPANDPEFKDIPFTL